MEDRENEDSKPTEKHVRIKCCTRRLCLAAEISLRQLASPY